ncbi:hypothetical protein N7451_012162 [Penicillium sp. IBT 35674x]|nr:hypothetical protein N7451_012162 [Penicillium sp. IBT 35674x]
MKFQSLAAAMSVLAFALAQADYASICPSKHNGSPEEITPGFYVQYKCDTRGPYKGSVVDASSPKECVELCQTSELDCRGGTWYNDKCVFAKDDGSVSAHPGAVYMKRVDDPFGGTQSDPFAQTCEDRELALQQQLAQCQIDLAAAQAPPKTPPSNGLTATVGGKKYRVWCSANNGATTDKGSFTNVPDFNTCVAHCTNTNGCTRALWRPTHKTCLLFQDSQDPTTKPTASPIYHSAILLP